jgi:hypothetical protein
LAGESFSEARKSHALRLSVHLDNYRIHSSNGSKHFWWKFSRHLSPSAIYRVFHVKCSTGESHD